LRTRASSRRGARFDGSEATAFFQASIALSGPAPSAVVNGDVLEDAYRALLSVGHSPGEARDRLDRVLAGGRSFQSVEDILTAIYQQPH